MQPDTNGDKTPKEKMSKTTKKQIHRDAKCRKLSDTDQKPTKLITFEEIKAKL